MGQESQNRYTKKPRQPPLPPQLDSLLLNAAVLLMNIGLLYLAPSTLFPWGEFSNMNIIDT
jgi:hypothetical protein